MTTANSNFHISLIERPDVALARLLELDPAAASRALLSPQTLAPGERTTLADKWGLTRPDAPESRLWNGLVRTITNPVVLAAAILSIRYPIPLAKNMFKYAEHLSGLNRRVGPIMRRVGSVDELYHGTPIPETYKALLREVETFRRGHADEVAAAIVKAQGKGLPWNERTQVLLSAKLDGLDDVAAKGHTILRRIKEGPVFDTLVTDVRAINETLWDKVFGTLEKRRILAEKALRSAPAGSIQRKKASQLKAASASLHAQLHGDFFPDVTKVDKYFPHQVARSERAYERQTRALIEAAGGREAVAAKQALSATGRVSTQAARKRRYAMLPDEADVKLIEDYLLPDAKDKMRRAVERASAEGRQVRTYSLRFMEVMSSYIHGLARAHGWSLAKNEKGRVLGDVLRKSVEELDAVDPVRGAMMKDSYIPLALGRQTFRQAMGAARWAQTKQSMVKRLKESPAAEKFLPNDMRQWLIKRIEEDKGVLSSQNISARLAGYFYLGALGANPVSASANLLQTLLTTVPTIGPKYAAIGLKKTFQRVPEYFRLRQSGRTHEQALAKSFPLFEKEGLVANPIVDEALVKDLNRSWEATLSLPQRGRKSIDRVKGAMMAMFQTSENVVRLTAFEGGYAKARAEGLAVKEASTFARQVTERTQYLSGPANTPAFLRETTPVLKQFLTFPARTVGFTLSATEFGSGAQAGLLGRNLGTLGRIGLTSSLAYQFGREVLDRDIGHALIWGALPVPNPRAPFSPFPFVPPAASIVGAVGQDVLSGQFEQIPYVLPLAVPGGLAAARAAGLLGGSPAVAQVIGRPYANYEQKTPDGRVPVFTSEGGLRGYFTPGQIYLEALGIGGGDPTSRKEKELTQYLLNQRDRMRSYKKEYLDALVGGNARKAQSVQDQYEEDYPGFGKIQVKKSDLRAVHLRYQIGRMERILETMPPDSRAYFGRAIAVALAQEGESLIGVDPLLLQNTSSISQRDPWRNQPPLSIFDEIQQRLTKRGLTFGQASRSAGGTNQAGSLNPQLLGAMRSNQRHAPNRDQNQGTTDLVPQLTPRLY